MVLLLSNFKVKFSVVSSLFFKQISHAILLTELATLDAQYHSFFCLVGSDLYDPLTAKYAIF